jgi:hypothetical protein
VAVENEKQKGEEKARAESSLSFRRFEQARSGGDRQALLYLYHFTSEHKAALSIDYVLHIAVYAFKIYV